MGTAQDVAWKQDNRLHFDTIVEQYDVVRPQYPPALYADLLAYAQVAKGTSAVEIGPGTGKATATFLDAGCTVTAVEIGQHMADFLKNKFSAQKHFDVIVSAFEDAALPEDCCQLVYAAAAFHWVDAARGCPKVFGLLKHGGAFALFRYHTLPVEGNALYEEIQTVYQAHYHQPYVKLPKMTPETLWQPEQIKKSFGFEDLAIYGFADIVQKIYPASRTLDADGYIAMLETFADHRSLPDADRNALYTKVKAAIIRHGGTIRVDYAFQLYMGKKP